MTCEVFIEGPNGCQYGQDGECSALQGVLGTDEKTGKTIIVQPGLECGGKTVSVTKIEPLSQA